MALEDPDHLLQVQDDIAVGDTQVLGCYAVLGDYDFVSIVRSPDNDSIARFSLELGVRAGVGVVTMPAIPVGPIPIRLLLLLLPAENRVGAPQGAASRPLRSGQGIRAALPGQWQHL